jgi:hypothetical protein
MSASAESAAEAAGGAAIPKQSAEDEPGKVTGGGPSHAALGVLIAVQLAWVTALIYGVHRAIEAVSGIGS